TSDTAVKVQVDSPPAPPVISGVNLNSPSLGSDGNLPAGTRAVNIALNTSDYATCRLASTPNTAYASMPTTFNSDAAPELTHFVTINSLTDGSSYVYYI